MASSDGLDACYCVYVVVTDGKLESVFLCHVSHRGKPFEVTESVAGFLFQVIELFGSGLIVL